MMSSTSDIHIPVTALQARIMLQCFLAVVLLYYAMLDNQHRLVAKAFGTFYDQFMQCEPELERAHPRDPQHCYIIPARHHKQLNLYR